MKAVQGVLSRVVRQKNFVKLSLSRAGKTMTYKLANDQSHLVSDAHMNEEVTLKVDDNSFVQEVQAMESPAEEAEEPTTDEARRLQLVEYVLARQELAELDADACSEIFHSAWGQMQDGVGMPEAVEQQLKAFLEDQEIEVKEPVVEAPTRKKKQAAMA